MSALPAELDLDRRFDEQASIERELRTWDRERKAQAVLDQIVTDTNHAIGCAKRAFDPPAGCRDDQKAEFYRLAAKEALSVMTGALDLVTMLYQLNESGARLELSEKFTELLEKRAAEELGI